MKRLMLTIYVDSLEDAQAAFNALARVKENQAGADDPCPSLDWDQTWEEAEEDNATGS